MPTKKTTTAKAAPKAAPATPITIKDKTFEFGGKGTTRRASWDALAKQKGKKTREKYLANGGAPKYLPRWRKAGAIDYTLA